MNKRILNWAESQHLLDDNTPQLHMLKVQRELGILSSAVSGGVKSEISQALAETVIHLTIVAELAGLSLDTCVKQGFEKGVVDVSDAMLIAGLQDDNEYLKYKINKATTAVDRLTEDKRLLMLRTVIVPANMSFVEEYKLRNEVKDGCSI